MNKSIYDDDSKVKALTDEAINLTNSYVFQIDRLSPHEDQHLELLLQHHRFPFSARVLDMACGCGEVALYWKTARPDLAITLNNISAYQLGLSGATFSHVCSPAEDTGLPDASFDFVTLQYAIGHLDLHDFLTEVSRLLVPGGFFCIYDLFVHASPDNLSQLAYSPVHFLNDLVPHTKAAGLQLDFIQDVPRALQPWHGKVGITEKLLLNTHTLFARFEKV